MAGYEVTVGELLPKLLAGAARVLGILRDVAGRHSKFWICLRIIHVIN